jgi:hypothetical protein
MLASLCAALPPPQVWQPIVPVVYGLASLGVVWYMRATFHSLSSQDDKEAQVALL